MNWCRRSEKGWKVQGCTFTKYQRLFELRISPASRSGYPEYPRRGIRFRYAQKQSGRFVVGMNFQCHIVESNLGASLRMAC